MAGLSKTQYTIRIRNSALVPQGALTTWTDALISLRMNDVGKWSLTVRADDPLRALFTRGNGIIVTRDLGDGVTPVQTICSGPIWDVVRRGRDNTYMLAGPTDDLWLKVRNALPAGGRPFMEQVLMAGGGPLRYYRLGDAVSTTTPADTSLKNVTGGTTGTPTFGGSALISGDPSTSVTLASASTQRVFTSVTGLPSGNSPISVMLAQKRASNPAATETLFSIGAAPVANLADINIRQNTSGQILVDVGGATLITSSALATATPHLIRLRWDGTTMRLTIDGGAAQTATPGALSVGTSNTFLGCLNGGTQFANGQYAEWGIWGTSLSDADDTALWTAFSATHAAYDTRTGVASTVLIGYVNANLITPVNVDRDMTFMGAAADPSAGTTVTGNARYDNLLALMQQLASAGGDIGFKVVQTANGVLTFSTFQPVDRTSNAKFSEALLNLFDYSFELTGPASNSAEVLGGGLNAGRTAVRVQDATSIANWGLVEGPIVDARDTSDTATMTQRGQAEVNAQSEAINLSVTPRDTDVLTFGRDYNLGDIIAITLDGATITNKIRSVEIKLTTADQEVVTPGIGNPTQGQAAQFLADYQRGLQLQRVQAAINRLNGAV